MNATPRLQISEQLRVVTRTVANAVFKHTNRLLVSALTEHFMSLGEWHRQPRRNVLKAQHAAWTAGMSYGDYKGAKTRL